MFFLERDGFLLIKKIFSTKQTSQYLDLIKTNINKAANELDVPVHDYLSCTGRWTTNSSITSSISVLIESKIKKQLEKQLQIEIICKKSNIICKSIDITDSIPFHQDISYNFNNPYHFSLWISLNNVNENSAPLQIVRGSHRIQIEEAVDFWYPYFIDKYEDNKNTESLLVNAGDAILFDSRIFHGSKKNNSNQDRFAYVTRWAIKNAVFPKIPKIRKSTFGMFNCKEVTNHILKKALPLFDKCTKIIKSDEYLILLWIDILEKNNNISGINSLIARNDLKKLNILNKAYILHNAGSISGLIYKNLWFSLLSPLNSKIRLIKEK